MEKETITTGAFNLPAGKVLFNLCMVYGKTWLGVIMAGVIIFIILGSCLNPVWLIILLMWIFMACPMLMTFLYFFYGLSPLSAVNAVSHQIIFYTDNFKIKVIKNEGNKTSISHIITKTYEDLQKFNIETDYLLLKGKARDGLLILPFSVFKEGEVSSLINILRQNIYATI